MVFKREAGGIVKNVQQSKITLYAVDILQIETEGTVLIKTIKELKNFSESEENLLEQQVQAIPDSGAKVIVVGAEVDDMALYYMNK